MCHDVFRVVFPPFLFVFPPSLRTTRPRHVPLWHAPSVPNYIYRVNAMAETHKSEHTSASSPDVEEDMSIGRYIATRIPTLVPPMNPAPNPFKALTLLNRQQWLFFSVFFLELVLHTKY